MHEGIALHSRDIHSRLITWRVKHEEGLMAVVVTQQSGMKAMRPLGFEYKGRHDYMVVHKRFEDTTGSNTTSASAMASLVVVMLLSISRNRHLRINMFCM